MQCGKYHILTFVIRFAVHISLVAGGCLLLAVLLPASGERTLPSPISRDDWVEPHAWTRRPTAAKRTTIDAPSADPPSEPLSACPPCTATPAAGEREHGYGDFVYRKLVNFLINEQRMRFDADTGQLQRTISIQLSREQYSAIRAVGADLHDVDTVLQDVWQQSMRPSDQLRDVLWSWTDAWRHFWHSTVLESRWLVHGAQAAGAIAVYVLARRHRVGAGMLLTGAAAFAVYRYLDGECHRKLEIERMADVMQRGQGYDATSGNPCDEGADTWSWLRLFGGGGSRREECIRYLESRYERSCDMKAIYDGFMQTFVYGSMEGFFMAIVSMTVKIRGVYGFIGMLLVTVLIYANLGVIIASCFKYVIGPVLMRRHPPQQQQQQQPQPTPIIVQAAPVAAGAADQLSGENIERLLSITESHTRLVTAMAETFRQKCTIAGEQPEAIEAARTSPLPAIAANQSERRELDSLTVPPPPLGVSLSGVELVDGSSAVVPQPSSSTCSSELGDTASEDDIVILEHFQPDGSQDNLDAI